MSNRRSTAGLSQVAAGAVALVYLLSAIGCSSNQARSIAPVLQGNTVLFASAENVEPQSLGLLGGVQARLLNQAADGRLVAIAEWGQDSLWGLPAGRGHTIEIFVLQGTLQWGNRTLGATDYVHLPMNAALPGRIEGGEGLRILVFLDPPRSADGSLVTVVTEQTNPWRPGVAAEKDTGQALKLEVRDLYHVPASGQRTWLVRAGSDLRVPWEVHTAVEEGFLVEGDYYLGECLPSGPLYGEYQPGGYFYRPGGQVHSGPESGSREGVLWLMRTPKTLTVEFLESCP